MSPYYLMMKRIARILLLSPIAIALAGTLWITGALSYYERATGHERNGLIGYHYSVPEWGFEYAPDGRRMERWSFDVPTVTTLALLLASAIALSVKKRRELRGWAIVGLWVYHFGCAGCSSPTSESIRRSPARKPRSHLRFNE